MASGVNNLSAADLYLEDETAWLEQTAQLVAERRWAEVDHQNLSEYLLDMAIRDRREVLSRLTVLLAHLLKWEHQPEKRNGGWQATIQVQRQELQDLLESETLRNHAIAVLPKAYGRAREQALLETGLPEATFPEVSPLTLEEILDEA
jgi:hypothetical protein